MKSKRLPFFPPSALAAASLALAATSTSAQTLLFSDNFLATSNQTPNDQTTNEGRQGGTLATLGYLQTGNTQIGNATNPAPNGGNDLLLAFGGRAYVNYDFSAHPGPIEISFKGVVNSANGGTDDQWVSFSVGNNTLPFVNHANVSSVLFRANGATELWDDTVSSTGGSGLNTGLNAWVDYKIVLSDTAGTGGAWGTGGSRITYFSNNSQLGTFDIDQLVPGEGYFGFAAANISGYDDLTINGTPLPTISGTWTNPDGGKWNTEGNWLDNFVATGIGSTADFNTLDITEDTTVNLDSPRTVGNLTFGDTNMTSAAGWTLTGSNLSLAGSTPTITVNALGDTKTATISAAVVGSAGLTKAGPGTLTLTGASSFSGVTTVSEGTLQVSDQRYFNVGRTTTVESGAVLELIDSDNNFTTLIPTSTITGAGTFRLSGNSSIVQSANGVSGDRLIFAMESGGLIDLQDTSSLTNGGWQVVNWTNNLAAMNVASGATFDLSNGQNVIIDALNGSGIITRFYLLFGSPTLTLGIADGSGDFSGTITSEISVVKTGSGTQTFSGANSYSGNTTVNAGTLRLGNGTNNSNLADSADVFVAAGAILDLDFTGTDTIDELWLDGVAQAPGIYNQANSGGFITGSGSLNVENGPIADPFANWMATNFPEIETPDNAPSADPDNDGIANLVEFVLQGGNPSVSNSAILPTLDASGENFIFTYLRRTDATGTTQTFQYGSDLSGWTDVPVTDGDIVSITSPEAGIEQVVITVAKGSETQLFGRLRIVK